MDRATQRIALVEVLERDGRVGRAIDVYGWPLTLGRALDNHLVLDDPWVAPHHAMLLADEQGSLTLRVLDTRNGVQLDGTRVPGSQARPVPAAGAALQVGATRLRLRLRGETLAPEKLLPGKVSGSRLQPLWLGAALFALLLAGHWITLDPGADYAAWLPMLMGLPLGLAAWCGVWALMSKLFQHRFDFGGHLRIALPWMLAISAVDLLWPQAAASLAAPWLWQLASPLQALLGALLVREHLAHVLPLHPRAVWASVAALALAGGALSLAASWRSSDSLRAAPYMSTLPLPALRLGGLVPAQTLVQDMAPLADKLAQRVKKARKDDEDDSAEGPAE